MSAEARGSLAELARLRDEIEADRRAISRCRDDLHEALAAWQGVAAPDRAHMALAAVALHSFYGAIESILERVGRILDGGIPSGETWHRDLLSQGMTEIPSLRPAVIPRALYSELVALLEFRHFFRHAYGVDLDPAKLRENVERALSVGPDVDAALDAFDAFLGRAMASLSG